MSNHYPVSTEKLNWGAFLLTPFWTFHHKKYLFTILSCIPYIGLISSIIALIYGNKWAWESKEWNSEEEFIDIQNRWKYIGLIVIVIITIVLFLLKLNI
jgi:uncharacterized membrane protein YidH (DUF202 family)